MPIVFTSRPVGALIGGGSERGLVLAVLSEPSCRPRPRHAVAPRRPAGAALGILTRAHLAELVTEIAGGGAVWEAEDAVAEALLLALERRRRGYPFQLSFVRWEARRLFHRATRRLSASMGSRAVSSARRWEVSVDPKVLERVLDPSGAADLERASLVNPVRLAAVVRKLPKALRPFWAEAVKATGCGQLRRLFAAAGLPDDEGALRELVGVPGLPRSWCRTG